MKSPDNINNNDGYFDFSIKLNNFKGKPMKIANFLNKLFNDKNINAVISMKNTTEYKGCKITLKNMEREFMIDKVSILNTKTINWYMVSKYAQMTEGFMRFAEDKLKWEWICYRVLKGELKVSKKFMDDYKDTFDDLQETIDIDYESPELYEDEDMDICGDMHNMSIKNKNKDDILPYMNNNIPPFYPFSIPGASRYQDQNITYSLPPDIPSTDKEQLDSFLESISEQYGIPKDEIKVDMYNLTTGQYFNNIDLNNINKEEKKKELTDTYITLDNYKEHLIDIDNYDSNMWSWVSRKCWLSPEFVHKFKEKIYLAGLMNDNPHFVELMNCDWFFDKYISVFEEVKRIKDVMNKGLKVPKVTSDNRLIPENEL